MAQLRSTTGGALRLALALLVAAALSTLAPSPAGAQEQAGGIGLRLVEAPVAAKDDPRARIYIVDHLAPGAVIQRRVEVSNSSRAPHEVALYPSAATIEDGVFTGAEASTENELSRWTTVTPGTVDLPAAGSLTAIVTITVPDDAAPGERYGVVWAEARSAPALDGVSQVSRVGIRLYVSVGAGAPPAPDFAVQSLTPGRSAAGDPTVTATVRNTGGRALDVKGSLTMTEGPGGLAAGPFPAELDTTLAVGDTRDVTITLDERLPAGPWNAVVELRSGATARQGSATITFPQAGEAAAVPATGTPPRTWPLVAAAGVAAAALLLGGLGAHHVRGRRRGGYRPRHSARPGATPGSILVHPPRSR